MRCVWPALAWCIAAIGVARPVAAAKTSPDLAVLTAPGVDAAAVVGGALDSRFMPVPARGFEGPGSTLWLRIRTRTSTTASGTPVLIVRVARAAGVALFAAGRDRVVPAARALQLSDFRDLKDDVFVLPRGTGAAGTVYARIDGEPHAAADLGVTATTLQEAWSVAAAHERMIALAFGALVAMSIAAMLIWFVLEDRLFVHYAAFFSLQALYLAYLSGRGFDWPWLAWARPLGANAWNVPVALSGAVGCLFAREIAHLRHYSPRVHAAFRWLAIAFVALAISNALKGFGVDGIVTGAGNLMFIGAAVFTLTVAMLAWRRGIRAAGWFLLAWGLLEAVTIATAVQFLLARGEYAERLLYFALPPSMVAAAVLAALGVADRLRHQRAALNDAERLAQTDPLTGVLNRRSLIALIESASQRARARDLPIALLFIDLDHFKAINDNHGHAAGDACLRAIVSPIHAELRQSDAIGRYGGEEFVVILNGATSAVAETIAERIVERVAAVRVEGFGTPIQLTCSIGVAGSDTLGVWGDQLVARADAAVYVAKNKGRNRVQSALPLAA